MNIGKLKRSTQIAIMAGAGSGAVEKTASGTAPLTLSDSVAGNIRTIEVKGHSEVVSGVIKSIGDDGFTITTMDDDATNTSAATITSGLPLRSVSDSIYDTLDNEKVTKKCAEGDLSAYTWSYLSQYGAWQTNSLQNIISAPPSNNEVADPVITENDYTMSKWAGVWSDKVISINSSGSLAIIDSNLDENTPPTGNIVYALATPTETPLTSAEKSALASLRTYDHTTYIDATDAPTMTVKYMGKKTATRTAPKKRTSRKKKA